MTISWMPWQEFESLYRAAIPGNPRRPKDYRDRLACLRGIVARLHGDYPTPQTWFDCPAEERKTYEGYNHESEIDYLAPWLIQYRLCAGNGPEVEQRRTALTHYLRVAGLSRRTIRRWPFYFDLITDDEWQFVQKNWSPVVAAQFLTGFLWHTLTTTKRLRDFTPEDMAQSSTFGIRAYSPKSLSEVHFQLGYTTTPARKATFGRAGVWEQLKQHPSAGPTLQGYYQFLDAQGVGKSVKYNIQRSLSLLVNYLDEKGYKDCTHFRLVDFLDLTQYVGASRTAKTLMCYVKEIDEFFKWGVGYHTFFPSHYERPDEAWKRVVREARASYARNEGHAYESEEVPNQLAAVIYAYEPQDDLEAVCRWFWMLNMSAVVRLKWLLHLEAGHCLAPMVYDPESRGLYSRDPDKAGNEYGQFPVVHRMGIEAVKALEARAKRLALKPFKNPKTGREYVHLFGLPEYPHLPTPKCLADFLKRMKERIKARRDDGTVAKGSSHSNRHFLVGKIVQRTGRLSAGMSALGHRNTQAIGAYLKGKVNRAALAQTFAGKFERGEVSGHFYVRVIEILTAENPPNDQLVKVLTSDMSLDVFMQKYGVTAKTGVGTCVKQHACDDLATCWGCHYFILSKEETQMALRVLARHLCQIRHFQDSPHFAFDNAMVHVQLKGVVLITKHLIQLGLSQDVIDEAVTKILREGDHN